MPLSRILFIDAYDSFSNNIVSLLVTALDVDVDILPIDPPHLDPNSSDFQEKLLTTLRRYDAVVCGPGPGSPDSEKDVGIMKYFWELEGHDALPVLGVCLGFQSLVVSLGGVVKKLRLGLHGMIRDIVHSQATNEGNIFSGVPPFKATLYHSLHADIGQQSVSANDWATQLWDSPGHLPDLVPLAWTYEEQQDSTDRILMGVRHRSKPFWGLQYHPESVCTEEASQQVIINWFREASKYNHDSGRVVDRSTPLDCNFPGIRKPSVHINGTGGNLIHTHLHPDQETIPDLHSWLQGTKSLASYDRGMSYNSRTLELPPHIEVPDIVETLQSSRQEYIVLDSASANGGQTGADVRGRHSIIALDVDEALKLEYTTGNRYVTARRTRDVTDRDRDFEERIGLSTQQTVWQVLGGFWEGRQLGSDCVEDTPFMGGFMGYVTYELGLEGIGVATHHDKHPKRPDLCFAWITKSIVVDHLDGTIRIQCLSSTNSAGEAWLDICADQLTSSPLWTKGTQTTSNGSVRQSNNDDQLTPPLTPTRPTPIKAHIRVPDAQEYARKVRACQDFIASGDSYELCLTDETLITLPRDPQNGPPPSASSASSPSPSPSQSPTQANPSSSSSSSSSWSLYRRLRLASPAPFGSYIRLGPATVVSSSPERFLAYTPGGVCTMRPMKGTVAKYPSSSSPSHSSHPPPTSQPVTRAEAERRLRTPKETAENLMIVDLVRHDLHGVCGFGSGGGGGRVRVPRLLVVEEYASVWQMISVVEGRLPATPATAASTPADTRRRGGDGGKEKTPTGLDVLAATLPPGSMTGAPKRRSCEILRALEEEEEQEERCPGPGNPTTTARRRRRRRNARGLYAGVVGYMDVRGAGDWSVTIRSLFRWDDEVLVAPATDERREENRGVVRRECEEAAEEEVWHVGAGGAVTALSTPRGETDEMFAKLKGPLSIFEQA
ncbi:aminodeoxychorismate synthase [Xylariomycetidae sp. FL0641]|nr:aminodeoxychorismate synthase [Xylariomycetidae sp. FL0641]